MTTIAHVCTRMSMLYTVPSESGVRLETLRSAAPPGQTTQPAQNVCTASVEMCIFYAIGARTCTIVSARTLRSLVFSLPQSKAVDSGRQGADDSGRTSSRACGRRRVGDVVCFRYVVHTVSWVLFRWVLVMKLSVHKVNDHISIDCSFRMTVGVHVTSVGPLHLGEYSYPIVHATRTSVSLNSFRMVCVLFRLR